MVFTLLRQPITRGAVEGSEGGGVNIHIPIHFTLKGPCSAPRGSHTSPRTPFLNDGCFFPSFFTRTSGALTATRRTSSKAARAPGCGGVWRSRTCISSSPIPRPTASSKAFYAHHHSFILTAPMSQSSAGRGGEGLTLSTSGTRRSRVRIASLIHRWLP